jgi:hypothetical protein
MTPIQQKVWKSEKNVKIIEELKNTPKRECHEIETKL